MDKTKGIIVAQEVWNMLPDNCKEIMKDIKKSFMDSVAADVDKINEIPSEQKSLERLDQWKIHEGMETYSEEYRSGFYEGWVLCDEWLRKNK